MAYLTQNISIPTAWTLVADAKAEAIIQLLNSSELHIFVGATIPNISVAGHILKDELRVFRISGLTTEKVWARSVGNKPAAVAVTAG